MLAWTLPAQLGCLTACVFPDTELTSVPCHTHRFWELNSGLCCCSANTLPAEPPPSHQRNKLHRASASDGILHGLQSIRQILGLTGPSLPFCRERNKSQGGSCPALQREDMAGTRFTFRLNSKPPTTAPNTVATLVRF